MLGSSASAALCRARARGETNKFLLESSESIAIAMCGRGYLWAERPLCMWFTSAHSHEVRVTDHIDHVLFYSYTGTRTLRIRFISFPPACRSLFKIPTPFHSAPLTDPAGHRCVKHVKEEEKKNRAAMLITYCIIYSFTITSVTSVLALKKITRPPDRPLVITVSSEAGQ